MNDEIKPLAFYLPQYHPIPENDQWWGKGFTEWTNVTKARPLFKGHRQPRFPADLGYYDLRLPEVRQAQAELAKEYGIHGFVYYHYWFGNGKQLIDRPLKEVIALGSPDFPFCICWANQTWSGVWHGSPGKILIKQQYPGYEDTVQHFKYLLTAFKDPRYIKVEGKPLFIIYDVGDLPDAATMVRDLKMLAQDSGLKGLYIMAGNVGKDDKNYKSMGFDGKISNAYNESLDFYSYPKNILYRLRNNLLSMLGVKHKTLKRIDHRKLSSRVMFKSAEIDMYPIVVPNWDNTPRSSVRGTVLENSSPQLFAKDIIKAIEYLDSNHTAGNFLFIKSWNEWAEGNYLEPDSVTGYQYLEALKKILHDGFRNHTYL